MTSLDIFFHSWNTDSMHLQRISWIDIARGIGIIAVLYGHAVSGDSYRHLIYAFHMPLFFFLSGMVFSVKKYQKFFPFLTRNFLTIIFPYLLFSLFSYIIWLSNRTSVPPTDTILQHFLGVMYGNSSGLFFNVVLWFLPCLFVTKIAFWMITRISQDGKFLLVSLTALSVLAYVFSLVFVGIKLPFGIESAMTATVFFGLGFLLKYKGAQILDYLQNFSWPVFFGLLTVSIVLASINFEWYGYQIDMRLNRYSNYFLFYAAAISGIGATIMLSYQIGSNKVLEFIGKKSLELFVWHIIVFTYFSHYLKMIITSETLDTIRNTYLAPVYTVAAILVILTLTIIYSRVKNIKAYVVK